MFKNKESGLSAPPLNLTKARYGFINSKIIEYKNFIKEQSGLYALILALPLISGCTTPQDKEYFRSLPRNLYDSILGQNQTNRFYEVRNDKKD